MDRRTKIELGLIILFTLAVTLPFVGKAFLVDDPSLIDWARLLLRADSPKDIFQLLNTQTSLLGHTHTYWQMGHTPFLTLILCLFISLGGVSEVVLHSLFTIFPVLAGVSAYFISRRFTKKPLWSTLILISTPCFIVSSHNLMHHMPVCAFFLSSFACFIYGIDSKDNKLTIFSGILATFSWMTAYPALCLIPLFFIYAFLKKRIKKSIYAVFIPTVSFLCWFGIVYMMFQDPLGLERAHETGVYCLTNYFIKGIANLSIIGGATAFPIFLIFGFIRKARDIFLLLFCFFAAFLLATIYTRGYAPTEMGLFILFISGAVMVVFKLYERMLAGDFLSLWALGFLLFAFIFLPHGLPRYLLPMLLPLIIIWTNEVTKLPKKTAQIFLIGTLVFTLVTGISVAIADYEFAGVYPRFKRDFIKKYKGEDVWFSGEWGFRYYMEEEGYKYLFANDNSPQEDDLIVRVEVACPNRLDEKLIPRLKLIDRMSYAGRIPIRTASFKAHAGFHMNAAGLIPFSFSNVKLENFNIWRVKEKP